MEKSRNKSLIMLSVACIALSPFLIFNYNLIIGLLILVLGAACLVSQKIKIKLPLMILAALILILIIGHTLVQGLGIKLFEISYFIRFEEGYRHAYYYYEIFEFLAEEGIIGIFDEFKIVFYILNFWRIIALPVGEGLSLLTLLIAINSITKNTLVRTVGAVIVAIGSLIVLKASFENAMIAAVFNIELSFEIPSFIEMLIDEWEFNEIFRCLLAKSFYNKICFVSYLSFIIPIITFVLACVSVIPSKCKKHCCKDKKENVEVKAEVSVEEAKVEIEAE